MSTLSLPSLTIPQAATVSNALGVKHLRHLSALTIFSPAAISGVVTVQVADVDGEKAVAADWRAFQDGGADVALTAAKALKIDEPAFQGLRLSTTIAPGAGGNIFDVNGSETPV